jgi:hypothetical protein
MNRKHLRSLLVPALAGLVLLAVPGCDLVSVTLRIVQDVIAPGEPAHHVQSGQTQGSLGVDLTQDKDFKDNQDKIQSVDAAGFVFRVQNNSATAATGQIFFTTNPIASPTETNIRSQGTLILNGLALPGGTYTDIDFEDSLALQVAANRDAFHTAIKGGKIYLYGLAQNPPFDLTIDQLTVVIIITAGT